MPLAFIAAAALASGPLVQTENGPLVGLAPEDGSAWFRAIPFAAPPVGPLRWRPPHPAASWVEPRDATRPAPACPQPDYGWNRSDLENGMSEDCLYLEIRTHSLDPGRPLPVMVWIHGGNATAGRGSWAPTGMLHRQGIVLVSVQYRLGALGWMAHPALTREQGGSSGNYGLLDVQAALRWVKANIARFGGDPDNVTLFGNSAGAQIVHLAMLAPGARGLFHKAILQSGSSNFHYPSRSLAEGEHQGQLIAQAAGLEAPAAAGQLRALPLDRLLTAQETAPVPGQPDRYGIFLSPLVDGRVLTRDPLELRDASQAVSVPTLVGNNAREEAIFGGDVAAARAGVRAYFGTHADRALEYYRFEGLPAGDPRLGDAPMQAATDIVYRCVTKAISGSAARQRVPVWQYQYDYGGNVFHGAELGILFGFDRDAPQAHVPLPAYWANFARSGNPNGPGLPHWPGFELRHRAYLEFTPSGPAVKARLREPICDWFQGPLDPGRP